MTPTDQELEGRLRIAEAQRDAATDLALELQAENERLSALASRPPVAGELQAACDRVSAYLDSTRHAPSAADQMDMREIIEWARRPLATPPDPELEGVVRRLREVGEVWRAHVLAVERCNAAIPNIAEATSAEYAVYDERYRASEDAKRELWRVAHDLAKHAGESPALLDRLSPAIQGDASD